MIVGNAQNPKGFVVNNRCKDEKIRFSEIQDKKRLYTMHKSCATK